MEPEAVFTLPSVSTTMTRNLYYYQGDKLNIDETVIGTDHRVKLVGDQEITITNGASESYMLVLEGEPIQETVVSYGPFVMNTEKEIRDAFKDYQTTQFGGWPWDRPDPVNKRESGRFARHADGRVEKR
ncbi:pirin-like C-terminal cupin domain-containing protein [Neobacillus sp. KR4-4]|uniref:pirin-like C-terminal cupin domain-containing protein n=1 Tax=Neobacillus sp. KR4-4 TaxID=3344872 RepID=UPI0035CBFF85